MNVWSGLKSWLGGLQSEPAKDTPGQIIIRIKKDEEDNDEDDDDDYDDDFSFSSMALLVMLLLFLACWAPIHLLNIIEDFGVPV